jgi:putative Holliday junction resolvase
MALDVGFKRIGVALSDPLKLTAQPYEIIFRKSNKETFKKLLKTIEEKNVETVVIGLPLNSKGEKTKIAEKIEKFASKFKEFLENQGKNDVKIVFTDESFSTAEAEELMNSLNRKREFLDDIAAALILKEWLESRS